jgi:hypothetical protein
VSRLSLAAAAVLLGVLVAGCGGSTTVALPTIQAAAVFKLVQLEPATPVRAGEPVRVSFEIQQPNGAPLTRFKTGPGPHTGVHLILVRRDLAYIIHQHPPVGHSATITQTVTFPAPGPYRLVIDVYPAVGQTNFQLFGTVHVAGAYKPKPLPPPATTDDIDGYHFTIHGASNLKAIEAKFVTVRVTDPRGRPTPFTTWYGALAHAIFFRQGSLDYFHTHVCAPGATGCTSVLGGAKVTGSSQTPGKLTVGVLVPAPGTWRLFLQLMLGGKVRTAPFTLVVT